MKPAFKVIIFLVYFIINFSSYTNETAVAIGHHDYAPWNWESDGKIEGAAAEICKILFQEIGIEVDFTYLGPWKRGQEYVKRGVADINICSFINEERKSYSEFVMTPMGFIEQAIFVKNGNEFPFKSWDDLKGKKIGLALGVSIGEEFDHFLKENARIIRGTNYESLFNMLDKKRIDCVAVGRHSGRAMLASLDMQNEIHDLKKNILIGNLYISISKKSKYLYTIPILEEKIRKNGYYDLVDQLLSKYIIIYGNE